jgi:hypothetical protein
MLGLIFGTGYSPRPESWLPYVFTSPKEVAETGLDTDGLAVLDSCHDVIDSIPTLMRDEKAQKEGNELLAAVAGKLVVELADNSRFLDVCESFRYGVMSYANEQAIPREVETQREIRKIGDDTQKYLRYLELTAKRTNSIAFTIPRRRWFH